MREKKEANLNNQHMRFATNHSRNRKSVDGQLRLGPFETKTTDDAGQERYPGDRHPNKMRKTTRNHPRKQSKSDLTHPVLWRDRRCHIGMER